MARFNVITNLTNGAGLQRDATLLRAELERRGHEVHGIHFKTPIPAAADINIFLEVVVVELLTYARQNWVIPNPEWFFKGWPLDVWDVVLTKTHDATRIFRGLVGDRCEYLGWQAQDFYDPQLPRLEAAFLHVAGKSRSKNTLAVIQGAARAGVDLTVIAQGHKRVDDAELRWLLNTRTFCLLPSAYEGYGHSLHEAYGCGQVVLTTAAPPMNETTPAIFIRPQHTRPHHRGVLHEVSASGVRQAITTALALTDAERQAMSQQVRAAFEADRATFHANLDRVLEARL